MGMNRKMCAPERPVRARAASIELAASPSTWLALSRMPHVGFPPTDGGSHRSRVTARLGACAACRSSASPLSRSSPWR